MMLMLVLFACGEANDDSNTDGESLFTPSEYIADIDESTSLNWELSELEASFGERINSIPEIQVEPALIGYDVAMAGTSEGCPTFVELEYGAGYWFGECTSDDGTEFSGNSYFQLLEGVESGGFTVDSRTLSLAATIHLDDGREYSGGGTIGEAIGVRADDAYHYISVSGTFAWDGEEASNTWISDQVSPDFERNFYTITETDGKYLAVQGGISFPDGDVMAAVFDEVAIADEAMGSPCELEPSGTISFRTSDGAWIDTIWDGPREGDDSYSQEACDGCGTAFFLGSEVGEVCLDFSSWFVWEIP